MGIKNILLTEIENLIGHQPTAEEYLSALNYLTDHDEELQSIEDVKSALYDWRNDELHQCDGCGEYFLELEEFDHNLRVMGKRFCSSQCCDEWECWHTDEKPEISQHI